MHGLRRFLLRHRGLALAALLLALAVRALVPAGYMVGQGAGAKTFFVTLCTDGMGPRQSIEISVPMKEGAGDRQASHDKSDSPCAFSSLGMAALGGADPVLLAAALAFILLIGLTPQRAVPVRRAARLRPPLRAPPALS